MIEGYYTAEEIKHQLGLKARPGDTRTINKYVKSGKLEKKSLSRQINLYRFRPDFNPEAQQNLTDLDFCF